LTSSLYNSFPSHHEESPPLFFGGPAASMFLLLFGWPAAYMFPVLSGRPPFLFTFLRLSSSLYVSFVFGCWPPAFMFLIHVHAAFMFPLFRGIPPRRIVIICFVMCLVLHCSPTSSSLYVSNVFPSQQPLCFISIPQRLFSFCFAFTLTFQNVFQ
jgi:hypothetical protein